MVFVSVKNHVCRILFCLYFGNLTISRLFNVFKILIDLPGNPLLKCRILQANFGGTYKKGVNTIFKKALNDFLYRVITLFALCLSILHYYAILKGVITPFHFALLRRSKKHYYAFLKSIITPF